MLGGMTIVTVIDSLLDHPFWVLNKGFNQRKPLLEIHLKKKP